VENLRTPSRELPASAPVRWGFGVAEFWLVLYVCAGTVKAIPMVADAIPIDLTAAFGVLCVTALGMRALAVGRLHPKKLGTFDALLVMFCAVLALGILLSPVGSEVALKKVATFVVPGVIACYALPGIMATVSPPRTVVRNSLTAILVLAAGLSAGMFFQGQFLARSPGGSYVSWGQLLGAAIIAGSALLRSASSKAARAALSSLLLLLLAAFAYSGSRGPLVALAGTLLVGILLYRWIPIRKRAFLAAIAIAGGAMLLLVLPANLQNRYERLVETNNDTSIQSRLNAYGIAWEMFVARPLLGHGTASYGAYHERFGYPHNILLEIAAENGLLGLGLFLAFLANLLTQLARAMLRVRDQDRILLETVGLLFVFTFLSSLFSGDITARLLWFSAGLVAVASRGQARYAREGE